MTLNEVSNVVYQSRVVNNLMNENERMNCVLVFTPKNPKSLNPSVSVMYAGSLTKR